MVAKRGGLGRNLSALLSSPGSVIPTEKAPQPERLNLSISSLQPGQYQPRRDMDETALQELSESIKKQGLLQPLVVRSIAPERYEIIAGERRWRACQLAGMTEVPVVLREVDDETAMAMALVENLQREDLNAMEQARAMHRLTTEFALTHQQVADLLSKSRTAVSNYLRLLNLAEDVRRMLEHGDLDMGHARCLLMLDEAQQSQVAQMVVAKDWSVRETERWVARLKANPTIKQPALDISPLFTDKLHELAQLLQTKVKLKPGKSGKGALLIHYDDSTTLERMIAQLMD